MIKNQIWNQFEIRVFFIMIILLLESANCMYMLN